jgi:hypothetical protein
MHSFQRPIRFLPETDYPRAFVSLPRIAGSGNEIASSAIAMFTRPNLLIFMLHGIAAPPGKIISKREKLRRK